MACLCSSDTLYAEQAAAVAAALRRGRRRAGVPRGPARASTPGVDAYVFAGCDAVAVLSATLDRMGVA